MHDAWPVTLVVLASLAFLAAGFLLGLLLDRRLISRAYRNGFRDGKAFRKSLAAAQSVAAAKPLTAAIANRRAPHPIDGPTQVLPAVTSRRIP